MTVRAIALACALGLSASLVGRPAIAEEPRPRAPVLAPPTLKVDAGAAYPAQALAERFFQTVTVMVSLEVDATGAVRKASVDEPQGHGFDEAAIAAAQRLVFAPATRDGAPVAARIKFRYVFAPPAPRLVGRVARRGDDAPIAGARVTVRAADGSEHVVVTGADGAWTAPALPWGEVHVSVVADGFDAASADDALSPGEETRIVLRLAAIAPKSAVVAATPDAGAPPPVQEIVVQGERPPREVIKRTMSAEEIGHIPGTNGDALRSISNLPGVARPPPFGGLLIVRGSAPQDTNIYVDGTNIPIVYHFGGLSSVVPTELLKKIDFYPGNYSAQFGRGMGGIVDVGIRDPKKDGHYHGMAQVDLIDARALAEGPIGGGWNFLAAARRSWFDVWLGPVLRRTQAGVTVAPRYYDWQAELQKDFGKRASFRVLFFGSSDAIDILRQTASQSNPTLGGDLYDHTAFWRLQARYENRIADRTELRVTGAVGQDIQEIGFGTDFSRTTTTPMTLRAELSQKVARGVVANAGVDTLYVPYDVHRRLPPPRRPGIPSGGPGEIPVDSAASGSIVLPAVYTEWELSPRRGTRIVPGLRVDYANATSQLDVAPRVVVRQDVASAFPRTTLKGAVGLFYQPPQPIETDPLFGQKNLVSNRSVHYDLGFEQELSRQIDLSTDVFYKDMDELVVPGVGNGGVGFAYGVEWLLRYKPDARFFGWVAYTLSRSERRDVPGDPFRLIRYDQTHILTVLGSYKIGAGWQIGARFRLVSGNLYTPSSEGAYDATVGSQLSSNVYPPFGTRLPPFEQLDVRVDKTWAFAAWRLTLYLDVQNVYNRANPEGVAYNYNYTQSTYVSGLPILPSVGVRGEF